MDSFRQRSDWGALPVVRLLWSILAGRLRRVLTAVRGTDRQSAALQQVAAAYWGVTDLTNGVRGGLWPGGSARRMAGWQVSWTRTAALGGMKPAARVSHSLLAGSGFPACPE